MSSAFCFSSDQSKMSPGNGLTEVLTYTKPQKKRRNFSNSKRYGKQRQYLFLFFKLQVFIATQGVGTHHKE